MPDALKTWHKMIETGDMTGLDALLAEDAVFLSPIVHHPPDWAVPWSSST